MIGKRLALPSTAKAREGGGREKEKLSKKTLNSNFSQREYL
jgi:hypothetical protein